MRVTPLVMAGVLVAALAVPAHATDPVPGPVDYCGSATTGRVHAITTGTCDPATELSLGVGPIVHGANRPTHLNHTFYNRYRVARAAARKKGFRLQITSGWRSLAAQRSLYRQSVRRYGISQRWVMPATVSNHPWGLALDVRYTFHGHRTAAWLERYGYKYGLCRAYRNEWWHFEPLTSPGTKCPAPKRFPAW